MLLVISLHHGLGNIGYNSSTITRQQNKSLSTLRVIISSNIMLLTYEILGLM